LRVRQRSIVGAAQHVPQLWKLRPDMLVQLLVRSRARDTDGGADRGRRRRPRKPASTVWVITTSAASSVKSKVNHAGKRDGALKLPDDPFAGSRAAVIHSLFLQRIRPCQPGRRERACIWRCVPGHQAWYSSSAQFSRKSNTLPACRPGKHAVVMGSSSSHLSPLSKRLRGYVTYRVGY
jgi:hypothetical protein